MEALDFIAGLAELVLCILDSVSWFKSRENRKEIKEAKQSGLPEVEKNVWTKLFRVLTAVIIILFLIIGIILLIRTKSLPGFFYGNSLR